MIKANHSLKLTLIILLAVPGMAIAQSGPSPDENGPGLKKRVEAWIDGQDRAMSGSYSGVVFEEEAFDDIYDDEYYPMIRLGSYWYPVENLYLGVLVGGMYETGETVGALTSARSGLDAELTVIPVQVDLGYKFDFWDKQILVPYVWGGYDWWYFEEDLEEADDTEGDKNGWHWGAGVGILLDPMDKPAAATMKRWWGVDDTYLVLAYEEARVGEDEDGIDFSGVMYSAGLRFELRGGE